MEALLCPESGALCLRVLFCVSRPFAVVLLWSLTGHIVSVYSDLLLCECNLLLCSFPRVHACCAYYNYFAHVLCVLICGGELGRFASGDECATSSYIGVRNSVFFLCPETRCGWRMRRDARGRFVAAAAAESGGSAFVTALLAESQKMGAPSEVAAYRKPLWGSSLFTEF